MKKNILLVEYDESTINSIKEILPPHAFDLFVASDGEMAKRLLPTRHFDMMITAAMLPRFHGFNLSQTVAQEHPDIKIIIISAIYKGLEYKHQAVTTYRASDFFEKPLDKGKFRNRVLELLGLSVDDLLSTNEAAQTQVPIFDTAKMPAMSKIAAEENKLSSDDIFGDIIKKIEKVPSFEIKLEEGADKPAPVASKPAPAKPAASRPAAGAPRSSDDLNLLERMKDLQRSAESRPRPAETQLAGLGQDRKAPPPDDKKLRKIEDDIARKFEETLSGLGIKKTGAPPAARPPEPRAETQIPAIPVPSPAAPRASQTVAMPRPAAPAPAPKAQPAEPPARPAPVPPPPRPTPMAVTPPPVPKPSAPPPAPAAREMRTEVLHTPPPVESVNEVGDYVLLGLIARGGMAEVYKAKKKGVKGFEKVIAIKKILSGFGEDDKYVEMLVDEAKIAAELSHPNIIQIYDLGKKDSYYFIAMEYVLGKDLREILRRLAERGERMPVELALYVIIRVLEALNYAHKAKDTKGRHLEIVHRDVSPPNILISYNGDVKLTDFGVSKATIKIHQTLSGALKGKLLYMSPEQARGDGLDSRSDLYSAGVVLFELLTGRKLFMDASEMSVLKKVQNGDIIRPRDANPDLDPELETIILKVLAADSGKRYQTAGAMIADLEAYIMKRYDFIPGPVHFAHFLFRLFENEILKEGIKVELKPIPEPVRLRPAPAEPRPPVEKARPTPPPPPPVLEEMEKPEKPFEISFEPAEPPSPAPSPLAEAPFVLEAEKREALFSGVTEEKKKSLLLPILLAVLILGGAVAAYFAFFRSAPSAGPSAPAASGPGAVKTETVASPELGLQTNPTAPGAGGAAVPAGSPTPAGAPATVKGGAVAAVNQAELDKAKADEELRKQQEAEAKKKQQDEQKRKAAELEKQKADEEARLKAEDEARQKAAEEQRLKAEDEARQKAAEEEQRKKAEDERRRAEAAKPKEGDTLPLSDVTTPPVVISQPAPAIPRNLISTMPPGTRTMVTFLIDQNGNVETVRLLPKTGNEQVNEILINTVKSWKFKPATKDNVRVKVWKNVPISISK